jgi:alginate O-acetyltransferase complex protein AlgJ
MRSPRTNTVLVVVFAILLIAPTAAQTLGLEPFSRLNEKRVLAPKPLRWLGSAQGEVTAASLALAAQEWDKYFTDHFGLRKGLVGTYRLFTVHVLNASLHPAVVIGEVHKGTRWYYFDGAAMRDGAGFESSLGAAPYNGSELFLTAENLRKTRQLLQKNGIPFVLLVVPDKQTVYPEFLPSRLRPAQGVHSRLEQFWTVTQADPSAGLIDLREPLIRAKGEPLFFPTDTHWNEAGAFLGYHAVINAFRMQDGGPPALDRKDVSLRLAGGRPVEGDLTLLMGIPVFGGETLYDVFMPAKPAFHRPRGKKLLVLSDSFFIALDPYFKFEFDQVVVLGPSARSARQIHITQELLDAYKPSAVLLESVERYWTM